MSRVTEWIMDQRWAILPATLEAIIKIAGDPEKVPEAIAAKLGGKLENTDRTSFRDGIAVIDVLGPIFPRANLLTMMSGASSIETLSTDFNSALENPDVKGILFNIDSPGGAITGVSELANMIYEARGTKPIKSYIYGMGASAAYWLGSAADEVIMGDTAEAGSIGVVATYTDRKEQNEKAGVKKIEIVSSISPHKRPDMATEEGRGKIQRIVDSIADVFVTSVALQRGTRYDTVLEDFGKGDMYVGALSVGQGLADRLGSFESLIKEMSSSKQLTTQKHSKRRTSMSEEHGSTVTVEAVRESSPDTFSAIKEIGRKEGLEEGIQQERSRIQDIQSIDLPGSADIISAHLYDEGMTKDKMSTLILEDQELKRKAAADQIKQDAEEAADQTEGQEQGGEGDEASQDAADVALMIQGGNEGKASKE